MRSGAPVPRVLILEWNPRVCNVFAVALVPDHLAAGFQLKGSGWYATDFKGGGTSAPAVAPAESAGATEPAAPKSDAAPATPAASTGA